MPIHDWSRVYDGAFHAFQLGWIAELQIALNQGLLPPDYYAMAEQVAGPAVPDVLTLQAANGHAESWSGEPIAGAIAAAVAPPRVADRETLERNVYTRLQRAIVIHDSSDDRIIALIEILPAGNKASNREFHTFLAKAVEALERGYHLLLVDLQPPTAHDPAGIHAAIWGEFGGAPRPRLSTSRSTWSPTMPGHRRKPTCRGWHMETRSLTCRCSWHRAGMWTYHSNRLTRPHGAACPGVSASVSRLPLAKFEHRMRTSPGPPQELN